MILDFPTLSFEFEIENQKTKFSVSLHQMSQKVGFYTLGCKLNFTETSAIGRQFRERGYETVPFHEKADVYLINTCSVTDHADKKCRKVVREALKANPQGYVVIVGCYAQLKPEEIASIPGVDLVLGANEKFRLFEVVDEFVKQDEGRAIYGKVSEVNQFVHAWSETERTRSFLKVQDGCDYKCSFCTIPLARGASRSDTAESIVAQARRLGSAGVKEVVLTGVNLGDYGKGQPATFFDLVQQLDALPEVPRYRISSIEPNLLTDEIIRFVASSQHFMPHFHVPLQSGSDEMLALMRRRYRRALYESRVATIKSVMPHACIGVDVIVGFPGETEDHFLETYHFLNALDISYLHVFPYSERPNTLAATMPGKVRDGVKHDRVTQLRSLSEKKRRDFYSRFSGTRRPVLFEEEVTQNQIHGFTDNYIKVVTAYDPLLVNEITPCVLGEPDAEGSLTTTADTVPLTHAHG